jgi:hypothetical protein
MATQIQNCQTIIQHHPILQPKTPLKKRHINTHS